MDIGTASTIFYSTSLRLVQYQSCSIVEAEGYGFSSPCNIYPVHIDIISLVESSGDVDQTTFFPLSLASYYCVHGEFSLAKNLRRKNDTGCIFFLDPSIKNTSPENLEPYDIDLMRALILYSEPTFYHDYNGMISRFDYFVNSLNQIELTAVKD